MKKNHYICYRSFSSSPCQSDVGYHSTLKKTTTLCIAELSGCIKHNLA